MPHDKVGARGRAEADVAKPPLAHVDAESVRHRGGAWCSSQGCLLRNQAGDLHAERHFTCSTVTPMMHAVIVSALPTASANTYANQTCSRPIRSSSRGFYSTTSSVDKRRGFPGHQKCGCKRQKVVTHVQQGSGASTKVLKETAALDQLIDLFLGAKSQQQVGIASISYTTLVICNWKITEQTVLCMTTAGQACCGQYPQLGPEVLAETGNSQ